MLSGLFKFKKFWSKSKKSKKSKSQAKTEAVASAPTRPTTANEITSGRNGAGANSSTSATTNIASSTDNYAPTSTAPVEPRPSFKDIKIELTSEDALAVKESWKETVGLSPENATTSAAGSPANLFYAQFYENLFAVRPDLEYMFPDIHRQSAALSGLFNAALAMLENINALDEIIERMGRRHAYVMGVEPEHFEFLGVIFIQTLRDRLGDRFTPQIEITWVKIYAYLASKMIAAGGEE
ncbi:globin-like protein [Lipomyces japonicus]|uniref:globin-like protein n=1 Tax=Lipomyces japonicus TaxID=56871 RepID=UPI0034CF37C8